MRDRKRQQSGACGFATVDEWSESVARTAGWLFAGCARSLVVCLDSTSRFMNVFVVSRRWNGGVLFCGPMRGLTIAIDGPSGAGKGTVARAVAAKLGYLHVDSGAMYRAVGWKAVRDGVALDDETAVARLAEQSPIDVKGPITIDGIDITTSIRTPAIDRAATAVARLPKRSEERRVGKE